MSKWTKNKLFALASWLPLYKWIWAKAIREFINKEDIQLLHVHDLYMAPPAIDAIKNSRRPVKLVLDLHENFPATVLTYNWTKGFFKNLITRPRDWARKEKDILRSVDRIITLSNDYKDSLLKRYPQLDGKKIDFLPSSLEDQTKVEPVYKKFNGWLKNTSGIKKWQDLPKNTQKYIKFIKSYCGVKISSISTSPRREDTILLENPFKKN